MNLPNKLTILRMVMIVPFVAAMMIDAQWARASAFALFMVASFTDYLDGRIARKRGLITDFGKLMDPIADKLLVMSALVGLVGQGRADAVCAIILLGREFIISGVRMVAAGKGNVIAAGWLGKLKTSIQMTAIALLLLPDLGFIEPVMSLSLPAVGRVLLWVSAAISIWSLVDYIRRNKEVIAP